MSARAIVLLALAAGPPPGGWPPPPHEATVVSVYDGDTVTLSTGDKVRLRWVNTPELKPEEPWAREARALTEHMVMGQLVELDVAPSQRDSYGRVVAGVRTRDGSLSTALLEAGLGHLFVIPPDDTDLKPLIEAQERARKAKLGIWSNELFQGPLHITSLHADAPGPDAENVNGEYLRICNISPEPVDLGGFRLRTRAGLEVKLPGVTVPAGYTAKVMSGQGVDQVAIDQPIEVHLGSAVPIWGDEGDMATLIAPDGREIDRKISTGG
ncbi:MAG TPA: thermonuclease family protein [Myxococcota bacterium]|nr:thermonuclease family protein [Myxococcota bacterium]